VSRRGILVLLSFVLAWGGSACSDRAKAAREAADAPLAAAIARARAFLGTRPHDTTGLILFLDILHRRFGLAEFAGMPAEYERLVATMPHPAPDVFSSRRMLDASARADAALLSRLVSPVDRITHPALHARELALPPHYATLLARAAAAGGYPLTHVGLALIWLDENGHGDIVGDAFRERVASGMAKLLAPADGISDLEIEAATFLYGMGRGALVPRAFLDALVLAQLGDGGWSADPAAEPDTPNDHTSALALWLLLEATVPDAEKGPFLPQPAAQAADPR